MEYWRTIFGAPYGQYWKNPGSPSTTSNKAVHELHVMVNKLDPALRRAVFLGWSQSMSTGKRVEHMDKFMKENGSMFRVVDFGHEYIGPYNNKKLSTASWVEFSNNDVAKAFVNKSRQTKSSYKQKVWVWRSTNYLVRDYRNNVIIVFTKQQNYSKVPGVLRIWKSSGKLKAPKHEKYLLIDKQVPNNFNTMPLGVSLFHLQS